MPHTKTASLTLIGCLLATPLSSAAANDPEPARIAASETSQQSEPIDPAMLALATQIVEIGYPKESREALFHGPMDQTIVQLRKSLGPYLPSDDPEAIKILDDWIDKYTAESKVILAKHIPAIMDGMAEAYASLFSEEELRDILAFVETPSGKQFFDLMPQVMGEPGFADANQAYMDESMEKLIPAQRELLNRLEEHRKKKDEPAETT
ncbi:DUF2059 domain-containing protein [Erythrobacter sp. THAF29]|uniref:DUF2059 domain-containing protein n=1 Tax=Erythrobacter sp. THAF29 TaxID=2587851 RepID=UPI0012682F4D|nr:DUF2059 domain-containing protein [Erythrobacter sp. THAF29]QFT77800.1 hypothetical protein FIU90_09660 [Erythrobacter sp. THAF29]